VIEASTRSRMNPSGLLITSAFSPIG